MLRIGSIVLRVDDLQRQTAFWQAALGYVRRDDRTSDDEPWSPSFAPGLLTHWTHRASCLSGSVAVRRIL